MVTTYFLSPVKWIAIMLACFAITSYADGDGPLPDVPERVVWRKTPIDILLVVGEERLVHFPASVSIGLPQLLTPLLRSQSINGTLYLLAHQPFEATRVMVRSENDGPLYVLDISASPGDSKISPLSDVQVLLDTPQTTDGSALSNLNDDNRPSQWGYVGLTRYAAQHLYAPTRLIPSQFGVVAIPVSDQPVDLVHGGKVQAVPVAAWKVGLQYVTAVRLTNLTRQAVVLDPRELRGAWLAATFQHNRLLPVGSEADTTAVYLVSDRPFAVAL